MIELLVVTAILIIISGLVLANHSRFGGRILLENLAYDMALSMRQAQIYGISVQRFGSSNYSAGYGMHFAMATPASYTLFADAATVDGMFSTDETVKNFFLGSGYAVTRLCAPAGTDSRTCPSVSTLDVLFMRPEPDAWISANGSSCTLSGAQCMESARIVLGAPSGDVVSFVVDINGQVSVNKQ